MIHIDERSSFERVLGRNRVRVVIPHEAYKQTMQIQELREGWATLISRRTHRGIEDFKWQVFQSHLGELRMLRRQVRGDCTVYIYELRR